MPLAGSINRIVQTFASKGMKSAPIIPMHEPAADFVPAVSPSMKIVEAVMLEVAQSEIPVLLLAERGAGKKVAARRIHDLSRRTTQSFRTISAAALDDDPASGNGSLHEGTILVEELGELTRNGQNSLLRLLTQKTANGESSTGARLICGSTRDLEAEVRAGNLREDLYYRVSGVCLRIPPLRQRREDIPVLVEHFLKKYAHDFQRPIPQLSAETQRLFQEYSWPGNVRELENAARAIVALGDESVAMGGLRQVLLRSENNGNGHKVSLKQASRAASREAEKEIILRALTRTRWNRRRAAQDLQISYKALLYKLKQMGCSEYEAS
jgi:two-component system, NtrC family, response regulator AtoC